MLNHALLFYCLCQSLGTNLVLGSISRITVEEESNSDEFTTTFESESERPTSSTRNGPNFHPGCSLVVNSSQSSSYPSIQSGNINVDQTYKSTSSNPSDILPTSLPTADPMQDIRNPTFGHNGIDDAWENIHPITSNQSNMPSSPPIADPPQVPSNPDNIDTPYPTIQSDDAWENIYPIRPTGTKPPCIPSAIPISSPTTVHPTTQSDDPWESNNPISISSRSPDIPSSLPIADPSRVPSNTDNIDSPYPTMQSDDEWESIDPNSPTKSRSIPSVIPSSSPIANIESQHPTTQSDDTRESNNPISISSSTPSDIPSSSPTTDIGSLHPTTKSDDPWKSNNPISISSSTPSDIPSSSPVADPSRVPSNLDNIDSPYPTMQSDDEWESIDSIRPTGTKSPGIQSVIPSSSPLANIESQHPTTQSDDTRESNNPISISSSTPSDIPSSLPSISDPSEGHSQIPTLPSDDETVNDPVLSKKPNILLIIADDVGTGDIPQYWNSGYVDMPNIGMLSEKGVTFTDFHSTPLCAPSRYMLLSGNYQHRGRKANGSWNLEYEHNQFLTNQKSISEVLQTQGYHTGILGKWHLGAKIPPLGSKNRTNYLTAKQHDWSLPLYDGPQAIGFDESYITIGGIQESPYSFFRNGMLTTNIEDVHFWKEGTYRTEARDESVIIRAGEGDSSWDSTAYNKILVNESESFLDNHMENRKGDPFFLYVALGSVHIPHTPPRHYLDNTPVLGEYPGKHLDMLFEMDKVVGSLVSLVEKRKLSGDTIIMFTSDNGGIRYSEKSNVPHRPSGPLRGSKGQIWEGGHRVPMIMRYDGKFPQKQKRNHPLGLNDVYATICELVGAKVPIQSARDSVSFADYIVSNNTKALRKSLATFDFRKGMLQGDSYRLGGLKIVRQYHEFSLKASSVELYNLNTDLSETKDLSREPEYSSIIDQMLQQLTALGPCPDDVKGKFEVEREGFSFNVTCNFFRKKPYKCTKFVEGELYCNSICGRHHKACHPEKYGTPTGITRTLRRRSD